MTIRFKKASKLEEGDVLALPFQKTATVASITVKTKNRLIVRWREDGLRPTTFTVDQEVLIDDPEVTD